MRLPSLPRPHQRAAHQRHGHARRSSRRRARSTTCRRRRHCGTATPCCAAPTSSRCSGNAACALLGPAIPHAGTASAAMSASWPARPGSLSSASSTSKLSGATPPWSTPLQLSSAPAATPCCATAPSSAASATTASAPAKCSCSWPKSGTRRSCRRWPMRTRSRRSAGSRRSL